MLCDVIAEVSALVGLTHEPQSIFVHSAEIGASSLHMVEDPKVHGSFPFHKCEAAIQPASRSAAPQVLYGNLLDVGAVAATCSCPPPTVPTVGSGGGVRIGGLIVRHCAKPVFLAGGLNAANVSLAIEIVQPYGLDVCSGVRTDGRLDPAKLAAYVTAVEASAGSRLERFRWG